MHPLLRFEREGNRLEPGQVLQAYPPCCTKEAANGVSLRATSAVEAFAYLAEFSRQGMASLMENWFEFASDDDQDNGGTAR